MRGGFFFITGHLTITENLGCVTCEPSVTFHAHLQDSTVDERLDRTSGDMAQHIRKAALFLFTQECLKEYFDKFNFFHGTFASIILQFYRELFP